MSIPYPTVGKLIEALSAFDPNTKVAVFSWEDDYDNVMCHSIRDVGTGWFFKEKDDCKYSNRTR